MLLQHLLIKKDCYEKYVSTLANKTVRLVSGQILALFMKFFYCFFLNNGIHFWHDIEINSFLHLLTFVSYLFLNNERFSTKLETEICCCWPFCTTKQKKWKFLLFDFEKNYKDQWLGACPSKIHKKFFVFSLLSFSYNFSFFIVSSILY